MRLYISLLVFSLLILNQRIEAQNDSTALLIIDIQDFYFPGGALPLVEPEAAAQQAAKILLAFRESQLPVIHVKHDFEPGGDIYHLLTPADNEKVFTKKYANSFRETQLLDYLQSLNITNLVICGMQTHVCLEAGTRAAADLGFKCTVIADACATRDLVYDQETIPARQVHLSTLATLKGTYAKVTTSHEFLESIKK